MSESPQMVKFKVTTGQQEVIELAYEPTKTLFDYIDDLSELYDTPPESFKLVNKGKVLAGKSTAAEAKLREGTVMVVINAVKKQPKKVMPSKEQVVPGAGMSTGLGASSPFGVGGYQAVNHPQYMSAISQAVDPDKMEELLNDPQYQGMIEEMLNDPDTLRHLMNNDPMMQNMIKNNPGMKMVLENPALMKMVFNKETLKRTTEMMKNGGTKDISSIADNLSQPTSSVSHANPMLAMSQSPMANFGGFNPFAFQAPPIIPVPPASNNQQNMPPNPLQLGLLQRMYSQQLKQLQQYGFKDKMRNLQVLRQVNGDLDKAIEKLCSQ